MTRARAQSTVFLNEAALRYFDPLRGYSGKLRAAFLLPGDPLAEVTGDQPVSAEFREGETVIPSPELVAHPRPGIKEQGYDVRRVTIMSGFRTPRYNHSGGNTEGRANLERKYPALVGGIGIYKACCGHGPFVHVDVRGIRARWRY